MLYAAQPQMREKPRNLGHLERWLSWLTILSGTKWHERSEPEGRGVGRAE